MDLRKLSEPLRADQIEFRVQSINKGGYATILAYKDARADMQRLDDVCDPLNWKREHLNANHNCIVSIWNDKSKQWVGKEDTGTPSNTESAKGLASDSFKRACFNWGIGRELYDYPVMSIKLIGSGEKKRGDEWEIFNGKGKQTWDLKLKDWKWMVKFAGNKPVYVAAKDQAGQIRFEWGDGENAKIAAMVMGYYQSDDSEGLLQAIDGTDNDKMNEVWKLFGSTDRTAMTKMINAERKAQKEESK
jgi:hypothetical protein